MPQDRRQDLIREDDRDESGTHRLCALTRAELDPAHLIRFVASPSDEIVPDLARRLPGRGVWITAEKNAVSRAAGTGVFAKSLKRQVKVPDGLAETVDVLLVRRVADALSLANKAGLATTGFSQVEELIEAGAAAALVHGLDSAQGGREKLDRKFLAVASGKGCSAPIVTSLTIEQLSLAMGRTNVVHAALKQGGATDRFLSEAERLARYRFGSNASGRFSPSRSEV